MKLSEILGPERVVSGVSVTSKKKALEELSGLLAMGSATVAATEVFASLTAREKLGSTGLGHGVAIPHGRLAAAETGIGAFIRLKNPVDYEAHDGHAVDLIFGLIVPQAATDLHLKHLAAIAEMFSDEAFCAKLRSANDDKTLFGLLTAYSAPG